MQKRTSAFLAIFLLVQIIALQVLKHFPEFVEKYYSLGIYPWISKTSRYIFGLGPFSVGDLFYLLITIVAIRWLYKNVKRLRNGTVGFFVDILAAVSVVYFMFHVLWGFNYYRLPLHQSLQLESDYTSQQLLNTTYRFIKKSNEMHRELGYADSV